MRIDKYLSECGIGSRSEVKKLIKAKKVTINDILCLKDNVSVNEKNDVVKVSGQEVIYIDKIYIMLNKPEGYVSATSDNVYPTITSLISEYEYLNIFPIGRLDVDTTGLVILTNDGELSHYLLHPKHHVDKTYYVETLDSLSNNKLEMLETGVILDDGITSDAKVDAYDNGYLLTIHEGRFHQVKRMMIAVGTKVTKLKRVSFGGINLDPSLKEGAYRILTNEEIDILKNNMKKS